MSKKERIEVPEFRKTTTYGIEELANIEHQRWSDWQKYLHSICTKNEDGSLTIPKEKVERWERQIATDYKDLTEAEKESDRKQVMRYWKYLPNEKESFEAGFDRGLQEK